METVALDVQKGDAKFESDPLRHSCTCPVGTWKGLEQNHELCATQCGPQGGIEAISEGGRCQKCVSM